MPELRIMSSTQGDEVIEWDPSDQKSIDKARIAFAKKIKKGMIAYARKTVQKPITEEVQVKEFDPSLGNITMRPALAGG